MNRWRRFVRRHGWRAYALPMLVAMTLTVLLWPHSARPASRSAHSLTQPAEFAAGVQPQAAITIALGADTSPCSQNPLPRLILVSIAKQRVWMCQGHTQAYSTLVTTGAAEVGDGTPVGTWQIQDKQTDRYLTGPGYRDFVRFWMPFDGDFGFHDAPWQTMAFGAPGYSDNGSHGCVHLPGAAMSWLYGWAPVGTTVAIEA